MASVQTKITKTSPAPCFLLFTARRVDRMTVAVKENGLRVKYFTARHETSAGPVVVWRETEMVGGGSQMSGLIIANTQTL